MNEPEKVIISVWIYTDKSSQKEEYRMVVYSSKNPHAEFKLQPGYHWEGNNGLAKYHEKVEVKDSEYVIGRIKYKLGVYGENEHYKNAIKVYGCYCFPWYPPKKDVAEFAVELMEKIKLMAAQVDSEQPTIEDLSRQVSALRAEVIAIKRIMEQQH